MAFAEIEGYGLNFHIGTIIPALLSAMGGDNMVATIVLSSIILNGECGSLSGLCSGIEMLTESTMSIVGESTSTTTMTTTMVDEVYEFSDEEMRKAELWFDFTLAYHLRAFSWVSSFRFVLS
ncbi:hypothetical protein Q3G72_013575 [Acer saccharum]|nr:hypothetical protein Q3G72_013575 [Acer saccharum]